MKKAIKRILGILLILIVFFNDCVVVFALGTDTFAGVTIAGSTSENTNDKDNDDDGNFSDWVEYPGGSVGSSQKRFRYRYEQTIKTSSTLPTITFLYDDIDLKAVKSGTWVGINIAETQSASWSVGEIEVYEVRKKYTCTYKSTSVTYCDCTNTRHQWVSYDCTEYSCKCIDRGNKNNGNLELQSYEVMANCTCRSCKSRYVTCSYESNRCYYDDDGSTYSDYPYATLCKKSGDDCADIHEDDPVYKDYYVDFDCDGTKTINGITYTLQSQNEEIDYSKKANASEAGVEVKRQEAIKATKAAAESAVGASFGVAKILGDNILPENKSDYNYNITIEATQTDGGNEGGEDWGVVWKKYEYFPSSVCMNLETGDVSYNKAECEENEKKIDNYIYDGVEFWLYFVPLNAKTGADFDLRISANVSRKLAQSECLSIMDATSDYENYIVTSSYSSLTGNSKADKKKVSDGCYYSTSVPINVVQKFYYEDSDGTFDGFNFYYRSIDLSDPFPNKTYNNTYSLWSDWYSSGSTSPDLTKSFESVTYVANITSEFAKKISEYNGSNKYPDFSDISLSGTSSFITDNDEYITRKVSTGDYYGLGLGPNVIIKNNSICLKLKVGDCS